MRSSIHKFDFYPKKRNFLIDKKIYCYEVTDTSHAILKDKYIFNEDIVIKNKALYDKNTTLSLNASSIDASTNTINDSKGNIEALL